RIVEARVEDWAPLGDSGAVLTLTRVVFDEGDFEDYTLPLALSFAEAADALLNKNSAAVVAGVTVGERVGVLYDALCDDSACMALLKYIEAGQTLPTHDGLVRGVPGATFDAIRGPRHEALALHRTPAEQSNSSVIYGDRMILKLFRRQEPGLNPDSEIGRY